MLASVPSMVFVRSLNLMNFAAMLLNHHSAVCRDLPSAGPEVRHDLCVASIYLSHQVSYAGALRSSPTGLVSRPQSMPAMLARIIRVCFGLGCMLRYLVSHQRPLATMGAECLSADSRKPTKRVRLMANFTHLSTGTICHRNPHYVCLELA